MIECVTDLQKETKVSNLKKTLASAKTHPSESFYKSQFKLGMRK